MKLVGVATAGQIADIEITFRAAHFANEVEIHLLAPDGYDLSLASGQEATTTTTTTTASAFQLAQIAAAQANLEAAEQREQALAAAGNQCIQK